MISDWIINPTWILLDTCSSASVCCNIDLVTNISKCTDDEILTMETNGGEQKYEHMATLKALPINFYFKSDSLANIIALSDVVEMPGVSVTMDLSRETVKQLTDINSSLLSTLTDSITMIQIKMEVIVKKV